MSEDLGIGLVGYAFMGRAHSNAWRSVGSFFDLPKKPRMAAICGRNEEAVAAAADQFGWESHETDWKRLIERDDIDIIDVCTPGSSHAEISIAALEAGKHVMCEKPLANTAEEAQAMADAAAKASVEGVRTMVAFNYRRVPAAAYARDLIANGKLGEIRHVRAVYLQDWIVDPDFPLVWRLVADEAGSGALGDIGAHIVDLSQFLLGDEIASVSALTETFIKERPLLAESDAGLGASGKEERGQVTVDDAALFLGRFAGGAVGTFEATRFATGRKNGLRIEVNGSKGSLVFDLERLNELEVYLSDEDTGVEGFRRVLVTNGGDHPYIGAWWPPGHIIGWEHTFIHEAKDFVEAIAAGEEASPSFAEGLQVQRVLDAVVKSAEGSSWERVQG
jgi:predicted dehydrogenase